MSYIGTLFKVRYIQDSFSFDVRFRHVSLYIVITQISPNKSNVIKWVIGINPMGVIIFWYI